MTSAPGSAAPREEPDPRIDALRQRIEDLTATLAAIRTGGVDAVLVGEPGQEQLYTVVNADRPYRVIVEEMGESAFTVSSLGVVLFANRAMREVCGGPNRQLVGSDAVDMVPPQERPVLSALLDVGSGETKRGELSLVGSDGVLVPALVSSTGLDLGGDTVVRCVVASDLSQVIAAQRELAAVHAELVRHDEALEISNHRLRRSNHELTQFGYIVSHDLSEPLRTIIGFADLLRERYAGQLDDDADEFLDYIVSGAARLQRLIDDLLLYSRVDTQARPFSPVDTDRLVADVVADLHARIQERDARVVVDPLPSVLADPTQLAQVFGNLIRNSLMFVADGVRPEIRVSAERGEGAWCFTVSDNGIGIPGQYRERVFGVFQRLHGRDDYPGTGIGLAVVEKVVHRHGGEVAIEDSAGGGTQVRFTIPDQPASAGEDDQ